MTSGTFRTFALIALQPRRGLRLSTVVGICLLLLVATSQAQGPHSRPVVMHFSDTAPVFLFNECTGELIVGTIAVAGVASQTTTNPGGPHEQSHFDLHLSLIGTAIGQTTGNEYVVNQTVHESHAGRPTFPFNETITNNFRLVSKGGSSNLAFSDTLHLTITATGATSVTFENVRTYCQ
jgi:hypothetical protein